MRDPELGLTWTRGGKVVSLGELLDSVPPRTVEWVVMESLHATEAPDRPQGGFEALDDDLVRLALAVRAFMCAPPGMGSRGGPPGAGSQGVPLAA